MSPRLTDTRNRWIEHHRAALGWLAAVPAVINLAMAWGGLLCDAGVTGAQRCGGSMSGSSHMEGH